MTNELPNTPDTAQSLFSIPNAITDAFKNVSEAIEGIRKVDYLALALIVLGLVIIMLALGGILVEETIQKPGREFIASGAAEKVAKLAKGG
jgi:hypothetical protein